MKIKDVCTMNPKDDAATLQGQVSFVPMQKISNDGCIDTSDIRNVADVCKGFTSFADGDIQTPARPHFSATPAISQ